MITTRRNLLCLCLVAGCLLAAGLPSQALADPYAFDFYQGPDEGAIPVFGFLPFHSHVTNMGDNADSYTVSIEATGPGDWTFSICVGEICYPPTVTEAPVPLLAPGETADFSFDVTALSEGAASFTITIVSDTDGALVESYEYSVFTPIEEQALLLSSGEGVLHGDLFDFISFHPVLFNAGTTADNYTLTMTRNYQPESWTTNFCVGEICYPPTTLTVQIPPDGVSTVAPGDYVELSIDFAILEEGDGSVTIEVVSNSNPALSSTATYVVTTGSVVGVDEVPGSVLGALQAVPNPFNPRTDIRFTLGGTASHDVLVDIFDATGRRVRTLAAADVAPGPQSVAWDGRGDDGRTVAAGVYVASVRAGTAHESVKMSLVK